MKYFVSLVLLGVSVVLLAVGVLGRTLLAPADSESHTVSFTDPAAIIVIDASVVNTVSRKQEYSIAGGATGMVPSNPADLASDLVSATDDTVVLAYGRTADVRAWVATTSYEQVSVDETTHEITSEFIEGTTDFAPNPFGADIWEYDVQAASTLTESVVLPDDYSLVIATDGALPAPSEMTITWKLPVDLTVSNIIMLVAFAIGAVGIGFFGWQFFNDKRGRRYRQGRMPKAPKGPRWRPRSVIPIPGRGRRAVRKFVIISALVPIALTGCSSVDPTPTTTTTASDEPAPYVAVTEKQFARIIQNAAATMAIADENRDESLAATRLTGPALKFRAIAYRLRAANKNLGDPFVIPAGPVRVVLPQQTDTWPRSVFAIVDDAENPDSPSVAMILEQNSPRENYLISYVVALEPSVVVPEVPSAELGTARLDPETALISQSPLAVIEAYADVMLNGADSEFAATFSEDTLQEQVGAAAKAARAKELGSSARFSWKEQPGDFEPVVLATTNAGALVSMTFIESETVKPKEQGSAITTSGAVKVLSGKANSVNGVTAQYEYQVLFYVPQIGSQDRVRLLGYSYSLIRAFALSG